MNAEDQWPTTSDQEDARPLGKAVIMSAEAETAEIIRRRLFEWAGLPDDAKKTLSLRRLGRRPQQMAGTSTSIRPATFRRLSVPPGGALGLRAEVAGPARFQRTRGVCACWRSGCPTCRSNLRLPPATKRSKRSSMQSRPR